MAAILSSIAAAMAAMTPATASLVGAGIGAVGSLVAGKQSADAQDRATAQNTADAKRTADLADQANNKANAKMPNLGTLLTGNAEVARQGIASTLLTGPQGIESGKLQLGKSTLLGS